MEVKKKDEFKYGFIIPLIVAGTLIGIPFIMYSKLSVIVSDSLSSSSLRRLMTSFKSM